MDSYFNSPSHYRIPAKELDGALSSMNNHHPEYVYGLTQNTTHFVETSSINQELSSQELEQNDGILFRNNHNEIESTPNRSKYKKCKVDATVLLTPTVDYNQTSNRSNSGTRTSKTSTHDSISHQQPIIQMDISRSSRTDTRPATQPLQLIRWTQRPKFATFFWEEENTLCYQVNANNICVSRRRDNDMINGTKLLNVTGMSRGKRDGILKNERARVVVKVGPMHLKGVWIIFSRAKDLARQFKIMDSLHPLLLNDPGVYFQKVQNQKRLGISLPTVQDNSIYKLGQLQAHASQACEYNKPISQTSSFATYEKVSQMPTSIDETFVFYCQENNESTVKTKIDSSSFPAFTSTKSFNEPDSAATHHILPPYNSKSNFSNSLYNSRENFSDFSQTTVNIDPQVPNHSYDNTHYYNHHRQAEKAAMLASNIVSYPLCPQPTIIDAHNYDTDNSQHSKQMPLEWAILQDPYIHMNYHQQHNNKADKNGIAYPFYQL